MAEQVKEYNYLENMVAKLGRDGAAERLSIWVSDICKAAPASRDTDDVINFLLYLKQDVLNDRVTV